MYFTLRAVWAAAYMERWIASIGGGVSLVLLAKSTGLTFSGRVSEQDPWYLDVKFGETNNHFVWGAVIVFVTTLTAVVIIQGCKSRR
jgi:hypothetical protein